MATIERIAREDRSRGGRIARLFLDTAPVIYYVERNPTYDPLVTDIFRRIDSGSLTAVTSPVTLAECLVLPCRIGLASPQKDFTDLVVRGDNTVFMAIDAPCATAAADMRARYNLTLTDSLQLAAAICARCDAFLRNDADLKRVVELRVLELDDLEV